MPPSRSKGGESDGEKGPTLRVCGEDGMGTNMAEERALLRLLCMFVVEEPDGDGLGGTGALIVCSNAARVRMKEVVGWNNGRAGAILRITCRSSSGTKIALTFL